MIVSTRVFGLLMCALILFDNGECSAQLSFVPHVNREAEKTEFDPGDKLNSMVSGKIKNEFGKYKYLHIRIFIKKRNGVPVTSVAITSGVSKGGTADVNQTAGFEVPRMGFEPKYDASALVFWSDDYYGDQGVVPVQLLKAVHTYEDEPVDAGGDQDGFAN